MLVDTGAVVNQENDMSLEQANAFRDYVSQNEDVQKEIRSALMTESAKVSEIAAKHGFSFTSEEGQEA